MVATERYPRQDRFLQDLSRFLITVAIGGAGVAVFFLAALPLPFLLGSMAASVIAAVIGIPMLWPAVLRIPARVSLGLIAGLAFSPALIGRLPQMAISLALLLPVTAVAVLGGYLFFRYVARFDGVTSFFAAVPGGFQEMVSMGHDAGGSARKLSLIHSTRLLVLVYVLPFWIIWSEGLSMNVSIGVPSAPRALTLTDIALLGTAALAGWWLAKRIRLSGALIIGPMLAAALLSVTGLTDAHLPAAWIDAAQVIIGIEIGLKFKGVTVREFFSTIAYGLVFTAFLLGLAALTAHVAVRIAGVPWASALMAFSPGGQGEKNLLAIALKADVAYVALHHLLRLAMVIVGAQLIFHKSPAGVRVRNARLEANDDGRAP